MADIMLGQLLHRPTIDPISGDSPLPVQLSGSKAELVRGSHDSATTIASGGAEDITIQPAANTLAELVWIRFQLSAPTGATSGTHKVEVAITASSAHYIMYAKSVAYNEPIVFTLADLLSITQSLGSWVFTAADPLIVRYTNSTDAAQSASRYLRTRRIERSVF